MITAVDLRATCRPTGPDYDHPNAPPCIENDLHIASECHHHWSFQWTPVVQNLHPLQLPQRCRTTSRYAPSVFRSRSCVSWYRHHIAAYNSVAKRELNGRQPRQFLDTSECQLRNRGTALTQASSTDAAIYLSATSARTDTF